LIAQLLCGFPRVLVRVCVDVFTLALRSSFIVVLDDLFGPRELE
jgi:hypothetical protein